MRVTVGAVKSSSDKTAANSGKIIQAGTSTRLRKVYAPPEPLPKFALDPLEALCRDDRAVVLGAEPHLRVALLQVFRTEDDCGGAQASAEAGPGPYARFGRFPLRFRLRVVM